MASLLAARCKHLAAAHGFHARPEAMRLGATSFARLICSLRQSYPPFNYVPRGPFVSSLASTRRRMRKHTTVHKPPLRLFAN
jgi:hypothetical protein